MIFETLRNCIKELKQLDTGQDFRFTTFIEEAEAVLREARDCVVVNKLDIAKLIDYNYWDEKKHLEEWGEDDSEDHIFHVLQRLKNQYEKS
jgi:hypothetical protein